MTSARKLKRRHSIQAKHLLSLKLLKMIAERLLVRLMDRVFEACFARARLDLSFMPEVKLPQTDANSLAITP